MLSIAITESLFKSELSIKKMTEYLNPPSTESHEGSLVVSKKNREKGNKAHFYLAEVFSG